MYTSKEEVFSESKFSLLLVDDCMVTRLIFSRKFAEAGWDVTSVEDGFLGYHKALEKKFNLILSDVEMPNMTGIEFLKKTKKGNNFNVDTPFIMMSSEPKFRKDSLASGACAFIHKEDISPGLFPEMVKKFL